MTDGDIPVVWTNTQYKMLYMNMGHGDKIFTSPVQNTLIENATMAAGLRRPGKSTGGCSLSISFGSARDDKLVEDQICVSGRKPNLMCNKIVIRPERR